MQKIVFYPSIFTPEESNSMAKQLIVAVDSSKSADEILLKAKAALETTNGKLTSTLKALLANPFTQQLNNADGWRDSVYVGGRNAIEAYTHWVFDTAKKEAAERLIEVVNRHGWSLQNFNYQKQSSATNSLLKELQSVKNQADLASLGLSTWYEELSKAQQNFENLFNLKAGAKNSKESIEKRDAQIPVNQDIEKLVTYINSIIMFKNDNEEWNKIYNEIEGIVKQMSAAARARRSIQNKPEESKTKVETK
ncbi:MAG: DUF6261 family protein [Bacteroidales bacterium]